MSLLLFFFSSSERLLNNWTKWCIFWSLNYVPLCECSWNSQLWKLYFRWVYVVIISSSHVTGCMFLCVCMYVFVSACENTPVSRGVLVFTWQPSQPWGEVTQEAAEGQELQTLHCCRGGERRQGKGQENHTQIKERDRNKESNERSLFSSLPSTAGSPPLLCCWIHKQMQTCSKNESVSAYVGQVHIWLWNVFTLHSL